MKLKIIWIKQSRLSAGQTQNLLLAHRIRAGWPVHSSTACHKSPAGSTLRRPLVTSPKGIWTKVPCSRAPAISKSRGLRPRSNTSRTPSIESSWITRCSSVRNTCDPSCRCRKTQNPKLKTVLGFRDKIALWEAMAWKIPPVARYAVRGKLSVHLGPHCQASHSWAALLPVATVKWHQS